MGKMTQEITEKAIRKVGSAYRLSKLMNVSQPTIHAWRHAINGAREKNLETMKEIARGKLQKGGIAIGLLLALSGAGIVTVAAMATQQCILCQIVNAADLTQRF